MKGFEECSPEEWERLAGRELRGGDPGGLVWRTPEGIDDKALYTAADIMLVTPLRDGMNLVAKEYIASRVNKDGVLILSEFAGAAEQLRSAVLVNPYDVDAMAETIELAAVMPLAEQRQRMSRMQRIVQNADVFEWARQCLTTLEAV